jgi:predicted DCC family thiol-disulfide oxidoreductase YuxK
MMNDTRVNETPVRLLIDGECPLCKREGDMLMRLDKGRGNLVLEDIASPGFDAGRYGLAFDDVMARIHGVLPDGRVISGMEVFRRAYRAVGWGWLLAPTAWPVVRPLADRFYVWFARNRLWLTGRKCDAGRCAPKGM